MATDNRVVWSEGMFLRPQHFQQADRNIERLMRGATEGLRAHGWGLLECQINRDLLANGRFALTRAKGVMPDGTPFSVPEDADHPPPLELPEGNRNQEILLALPARQPGGVEVAEGADSETVARYRPQEAEVVDTAGTAQTITTMMVARPRLRLITDTAERAGLICLGVARVIEVRSDRQVVLDDRYIPPVLDCAAAPALAAFRDEAQGLVHSRCEALAQRLGGGGAGATAGARGVGDIADFMMLACLNRASPLLAYLSQATRLHPESFFQEMLRLTGELATFAAPGRRPPAFPVYRHEDIRGSLTPVMAELRKYLSAVLEQTAVPIPLQLRKYGIRVGVIADRSLLGNAQFVLATRAEMPAEHLRRAFPAQVKIGPVERIRELVNVALPGIAARPLPVAPRQLPYIAGTTYFELERNNPLWKALATSGGVAIHLAGDFPGIQMELWAIRG